MVLFILVSQISNIYGPMWKNTWIGYPVFFVVVPSVPNSHTCIFRNRLVEFSAVTHLFMRKRTAKCQNIFSIFSISPGAQFVFYVFKSTRSKTTCSNPVFIESIFLCNQRTDNYVFIKMFIFTEKDIFCLATYNQP